jgi:hypothetical protein
VTRTATAATACYTDRFHKSCTVSCNRACRPCWQRGRGVRPSFRFGAPTPAAAVLLIESFACAGLVCLFVCSSQAAMPSSTRSCASLPTAAAYPPNNLQLARGALRAGEPWCFLARARQPVSPPHGAQRPTTPKDDAPGAQRAWRNAAGVPGLARGAHALESARLGLFRGARASCGAARSTRSALATLAEWEGMRPKWECGLSGIGLVGMRPKWDRSSGNAA